MTYNREDTYQLSPRVMLRRGDTVKVRGEYGKRFTFEYVVTNPTTGDQWLDVRDTRTHKLRAFYPDRVVRERKA